jgi:hypothetical protein
LDASSNEAYAAARAYFVVKYSCLVNYTLAHEIGHQLGAAHDWYSVGIEGTPNVVSYAHGYSWVNGPATFGFYTIMATDRKCKDFVSTYIQYGLNCPQVGRWSDPSATDSSGEPLGSVTPMPSHDARAITENRIAVANYRLSACRLLDC